MSPTSLPAGHSHHRDRAAYHERMADAYIERAEARGMQLSLLEPA
jgi:hypothetical protein